MYQKFFRFHAQPFAFAPQIAAYVPVETMEGSRRAVADAIERRTGPGLIIGPTGTGKSLLCQLLADQFESDFETVLLATSGIDSPTDLLRSILFSLNQPFHEKEEGILRLSLIGHLSSPKTSRAGMLLIIDEAHRLDTQLLEELRMLTNLVRKGTTRVNLVLAGSPALEEQFNHPKLDSLNQRVSARCYLHSLSRDETRQYISSQLQYAGGEPQAIFDEGAYEAAYLASDGIPRLINQVCDRSLRWAAETGDRRVTASTVEHAWADLQQLPLPADKVSSKAETASVIEFGSLDEMDEPSDPAADEFTQLSEQMTRVENTVVEICQKEATVAGSQTIGTPLDEEARNPFEEDFEVEEQVVQPTVTGVLAAPFNLSASIFDRFKPQPLQRSQAETSQQPSFDVVAGDEDAVILLDSEFDDIDPAQDPIFPEDDTQGSSSTTSTSPPASIVVFDDEGEQSEEKDGPITLDLTVHDPDHDDKDMIIIDEEPAAIMHDNQAYEALFAQLRQAT